MTFFLGHKKSESEGVEMNLKVGILKNILYGVGSSEEETIEYFKSCIGSRLPEADYVTEVKKIGILEARKIKSALESHPDLVIIDLKNYSKEIDDYVNAIKIKRYRANRPDHQPAVPKNRDGFIAGFEKGYFRKRGGGSNY